MINATIVIASTLKNRSSVVSHNDVPVQEAMLSQHSHYLSIHFHLILFLKLHDYHLIQESLLPKIAP